MRAGPVITVLLGLAVMGCVDTAQLTPVNAQARAIGAPVLHFARGMPGGFMKITMPDGESVAGTFSISETTAKDNFTASGRGPRTSLTCVGTLVAGHGLADCRSQDGAAYQLQL